jgi:hypothetical protein
MFQKWQQWKFPGGELFVRDIDATVERFQELFDIGDCLLIEKVRFAADSPLEGDGFEPSVPPHSRERTSGAKSDFQDDNRRRSIRQAE